MPRPNPDPAAFGEIAERVLKACDVGFAVVTGADRSLAWSNPAFDACAAGQNLGAAALARAILVGQRPGAVVPLIDETAPITTSQWLVTVEKARLEAAPTPATLDSVTGVLSRAALDATLDAWFEERSSRPFSVVFIDLVDFKLVNDRLGHVAGDECLAEVGRRLGLALRAGDIVGRYGGDEFVLLLQGKPTSEASSAIRRRVEAEVGAPLSLRGETFRLTLSFGVAASDQGTTPTEVVALADAHDVRRQATESCPNAVRSPGRCCRKGPPWLASPFGRVASFASQAPTTGHRQGVEPTSSES